MNAPARAYMNIGEVLARLRPDFPDVTISKIRFLEAEGLVEPQRTPSGYRKFDHDDVLRLRYVLAAQRDHYLPLKVIKGHLEAMDRGLEPPDQAGAAPRVPMTLVAGDGLPGPEAFARDPSELRLSRAELVEAAGLSDEQLTQLEGYGLISPRGRHYDGDALTVARAVAELAAFGLEARHLRAFKTSADRQVGLIEQVVAPLRTTQSHAGRASSNGDASPRGVEAQARADETERELAALAVRLHAALVKAGLSTRG